MIDLANLPAFSLLWPEGTEHQAGKEQNCWGERSILDLNLDRVAGALSPSARQVSQTRSILAALQSDPRVIAYRQSVLEDCLRCPGFLAGLNELLPALAGLTTKRLRFDTSDMTALFKTVWRLSELELYADTVKRLRKLLDEACSDLQSEGFQRLHRIVIDIEATESFQCLVNEMPNLRQGIDKASSITVGINLDSGMRPVEATLISINPTRFRGNENTVLNRLFGFELPDGDQGVGQLLRDPSATQPFLFIPGLASIGWMQGENQVRLLKALFADLERLLKSVFLPIAEALDKYLQVNSQFLTNLEAEIIFYTGAVRLIRQLQAAGLPMCRAEIASSAERVCELEDFYNLGLALRCLDPHKQRDLGAEIVLNDVAFGENGRIFILTGPNRGGKTTFAQGIGLAQALFQVGLYVPARKARLSPVDGIYTHFPIEENITSDTGRLGEEAQRLGEIFQKATRNSLVLLNETLSTTSPGECLYLARDVVRALKLLGVRAVFATHLHELAEINALAGVAGENPVISLVAGVEEAETPQQEANRTYKILPGPPTGSSYARDIARRHGISFEQLSQLMQERKVLE